MSYSQWNATRDDHRLGHYLKSVKSIMFFMSSKLVYWESRPTTLVVTMRSLIISNFRYDSNFSARNKYSCAVFRLNLQLYLNSSVLCVIFNLIQSDMFRKPLIGILNEAYGIDKFLTKCMDWTLSLKCWRNLKVHICMYNTHFKI